MGHFVKNLLTLSRDDFANIIFFYIFGVISNTLKLKDDFYIPAPLSYILIFLFKEQVKNVLEAGREFRIPGKNFWCQQFLKQPPNRAEVDTDWG